MLLDNLEKVYKKNENVVKIIAGLSIGTVVGMWVYGKYKDSKIAKSIDEISRIEKSINTEEEKWSAQVDEIEKNISIVREAERDALKEKIIEIKEQVKLFNKSIDSKEIRLICEKVAGSMSILTPEEKERFAQDLRDIGFGVQKAQEQVGNVISSAGNQIYYINGGWAGGGVVSASTTMFTPNVYRRSE